MLRKLDNNYKGPKITSFLTGGAEAVDKKPAEAVDKKPGEEPAKAADKKK